MDISENQQIFFLAWIVCLIAVLGAIWISYPQICGLKADYFLLTGSHPQLITSQVHEKVAFMNENRFAADIINNWNYVELPYPIKMPNISIEWKGKLEIPLNGKYYFFIYSNMSVKLIIDDIPLNLHRLNKIKQGHWKLMSAGLHDLEIHYQGQPPYEPIIFKWLLPGQEEEQIVPQKYLHPPQGSHLPASAYVLPFGLAVIFLIVLVGGMVYMLTKININSKVKKYIPKCGIVIVLTLILLFGFWLRWHHYTLEPGHQDTSDEYFVIWNGWFLLHEGAPKSWSYLMVYEKADGFPWFGKIFWLCSPFFDHPPLFSLIVASYLELHDIPPVTVEERLIPLNLTPDTARMLPLGLSLLTMIGLFMLVWQYWGLTSAFLSVAFYAFIPTVVVANRLVKSENFITVLLVWALFLISKYLSEGRRRHWIAAGILAALAVGCKMTGLAIGVALVFILVSEERYRQAIYTFAMSVGTYLGYVVYGVAYDAELFWKVQQAMSETFRTWDIFYRMIVFHKITEEQLFDGWILIGWLAITYLMLSRKLPKVIQMGFLWFLLAVIFGTHGDFRYGWYIIPLYPFLCLGLAKVVEDIVRERAIFAFTLWLLLPCFWSLRFLQVSTDYFRPIVLLHCVIIGLTVLSSKEKESRWIQVYMGCLIIAGLVLAMVCSYNFYWLKNT